MENKLFKNSDKEKPYIFSMEMEVRDYELDCEKIVNNANYLHYFEHTRHKFCESAGLSFIEMVNRNIITVVKKIEIEYFSPLKSRDKFTSALRVEREGIKFIFYQDIFTSKDHLNARAKVSIVSIVNGKLSRGNEIAEIFEKYLS